MISTQRIGATAAGALAAALLLAGAQPAAGLYVDAARSPSEGRLSQATPHPATDGRIVYTNAMTGQIETINPDGTARVEVTHEGTNLFPRWMPGSRRIIFSSDRGGDGFHLFTVTADGSDPVQLTHSPDGYSEDASAVTPDGSRVVFNRCQFSPGACALFSIAADGSDERQLTPYAEGIRDFLPDVSPDGSWLTFHRSGYRGTWDQVWLARLDGSRAQPITPVALEAVAARWMPDSRHLVASDSGAHLGGTIIMITAGPAPRPAPHLTAPAFPHSDGLPDPSPTGQQIVFYSDRAYEGLEGFDLVVMNADGSQQHVITQGALPLWPDWGTAALLPVGAGTPTAALAPSLAPLQRAALEREARASGSRGAGPASSTWPGHLIAH